MSNERKQQAEREPIGVEAIVKAWFEDRSWARKVEWGLDAESKWELIKALIAATDSEDILGSIGAGPLEDLLYGNAEEFIERVEQEAVISEKFRYSLSIARNPNMNEKIHQRIANAIKSRMKGYSEEIKLHVAGATIRHQNPFSTLPVPQNEEELSEEFLQKWVTPFYMSNFSDEHFLQNLNPIAHELSKEVVNFLLGEFNWRTRIVGAWFSAIKQYVEFEQDIGNLLLRSDVCYAGRGYCMALASFNTSSSTEFLCEYLEYYLNRPDLWFDQSTAMGAIAYLDQLNGTQNLAPFISGWEQFVANKPNWSLTRSIQSFADQMKEMIKIRFVIS